MPTSAGKKTHPGYPLTSPNSRVRSRLQATPTRSIDRDLGVRPRVRDTRRASVRDETRVSRKDSLWPRTVSCESYCRSSALFRHAPL